MSAGYQAGDAPIAEGGGGRLLGVYIETATRRGALKSASYHFEQDCSYISYQGADLAYDGRKLADGSSLPDQKPFEDTSWNPATRTFKGTVSWDPSFAGSIRWEYEMIFSADFSSIEKGSLSLKTTRGPGIGGGHDMQLSYGETGSFGLMYKKVAAGLEANYRPLDAKLRKEKEEKEKAEDQNILDAGGTYTATFKPGHFGLGANLKTGFVRKIFAEAPEGVKKGSKMLEINGQPYTETLLRSLTADRHCTVTFQHPEALRRSLRCPICREKFKDELEQDDPSVTEHDGCTGVWESKEQDVDSDADSETICLKDVSEKHYCEGKQGGNLGGPPKEFLWQSVEISGMVGARLVGRWQCENRWSDAKMYGDAKKHAILARVTNKNDLTPSWHRIAEFAPEHRMKLDVEIPKEVFATDAAKEEGECRLEFGCEVECDSILTIENAWLHPVRGPV